MSLHVAKIAVSAATYSMDRPYDYLVPEELSSCISVGSRVIVPFGRGSRVCEGVVLSLTGSSDYPELKPVIRLCENGNVLTEAQVRLALFMRDRCFCTVFDAVRSMLPAGLWFDAKGERKVRDKVVEYAVLELSEEEASLLAESKRHRAPRQAELLDLLCCFESLPVKDMLAHTGASRATFNALLKEGAVSVEQREVYRRPALKDAEPRPLPDLNAAQTEAYQGLRRLAFENEAKAALLFGVTGSGKTSVYIRLIDDILRSGRSAILLVPEIALTPQMLETFSSHFGQTVAVLHSSLSPGERYDEWKRIKRGEAKLVIGTRSAVFAPLEDLGIIIIDEEQEESYRSENTPRYDTAEIAKYLCTKAGALLLFGSATPRISTMFAAKQGRYAFFELKERFNEQKLPSVTLVDMKEELRKGNGGDISSFLRDEIQKNIDRGEQSILFINRRGTNRSVSCGECGFTYRCPNCSVSLTYHSSKKRMMCHYCGYSVRIGRSCPDCGGEFRFVGSGTEHVEEELGSLFPGTAVLRMDTDSVTPVGSHEKLLNRFRDERIPILVGTQMVAKGLNFENVTLVGVLSADQSLYSGNYRAGERTFSLITQVVGRGGRGELPGRAVIQTFTPDNQTIRQAAVQDYEAFYEAEIALRELQQVPPVIDRYAVTASGEDEFFTEDAARYLMKMLALAFRDMSGIKVLGPAPLSLFKAKNRFRYRVSVIGSDSALIRRVLSASVIECSNDKRFRNISFYADHDPSD